MAIFVTGGCGFIGSHTIVELINSGEKVIVCDNFSNSSPKIVGQIKKITNQDFIFYEADCCSKTFLESVFSKNSIEAVIHFAALKSVNESFRKPIDYYFNNFQSSINLVSVMTKFNCNNLIYSSSASIYGNAKELPIKETAQLNPINPYARTKQLSETFFKDCCHNYENMSVACLRYFNPVGAHESLLIGEMPTTNSTNLMPIIIRVASKKLNHISIFGNTFETPDGTGIRDYIHVQEVAIGHLKALNFVRENSGFHVFNLGTGKGYSVLEVIKTFEKVNNLKLPIKFAPKRPGDVPSLFADVSKAAAMLNFNANFSLEKMCADCWNFAKKLI